MYHYQHDDEPLYREPHVQEQYEHAAVYASPPPPARRRKVIAVASLAALLIGGVVVDRAAAARAESRNEDVSGGLGLDVSADDEPGRIDATVSLPLTGEVTVSAAVSAASGPGAGNRIAFTDVRVTRGELIPPAKALLDRALREPIPLRNIPEGLRLRSVTATESGISARFTGKAVTFRPGAASA